MCGKFRRVAIRLINGVGTYRTVTAEGKETIRANIIANGNGDFSEGLNRTEPFLVQQLPSDEKTKKWKN